MTNEQQKAYNEMMTILKDKIALCDRVLANIKGTHSYVLTNKDNTLVVVDNDDKLHFGNIDEAMELTQRSNALKAAQRWNNALSPMQIKAGCSVTVMVYADAVEAAKATANHLIGELEKNLK